MNVDVKISVIIPAYNCQNTISKSIDSIIAQSFKAHEIIVVDDGSSDNTFNYVRQMFPEVKLYKQENKGPASARNLGISVASGNWISFLDSDDTLNHDALKSYGILVDKNSTLNWIAGAYFKVLDNRKKLIVYKEKSIK
jgi:glycosyltransferase involved in cell wall biosynthesis